MKKIQLVRKWQNDLATTGELLAFDENNKQIFKSYVLENPKIGSARGQDLAVPFGLYKIDRYQSPKFNPTLDKILGYTGQKMMRLSNKDLNVPQSACVLIHWGNDETHTLGCPLLGYGISNDKTSISQSRAACKDFYNAFKDDDMKEVEFEIIDLIGFE